MSTDSESSFFDLGDNTALVCIDPPQYQRLIVPQLTELGYKVHLGLFEEDVLLKLATYNYHLVVVYENFKGSSQAENPILRALLKRTGALRRQHFVVLLSHNAVTNDAMAAFTLSVDLVVNIHDLANFRPVLRRGVAQHQDLYAFVQEALAS